jgi:hypothetical protein
MTDIERLFRLMWSVVKAIDTELVAHQQAIKALRLARDPEDVDATLAYARQSPALHEAMRQKYDVALETWLRTVPESLQVKEALKRFEDLDSQHQKYRQ